jgi:CHASE3 domain sensor protein
VRTVEAAAGIVREHISHLRPLMADERSRKALDGVDSGIAAWLPLFGEYARKAERNYEEAHGIIRDQMVPLTDQIDEAGIQLAEQQRALLAVSARQASELVTRSFWIVCLMVALAVLAGAIGQVLVLRTCRQLRAMASAFALGAREVAAAAG